MLKSPHAFPLAEVLLFLMSPPPHALRPSATTAATHPSRSQCFPRAISHFPFVWPARSWTGPHVSRPAEPFRGVLRDAVDHDAERRDRDAGRQTLAEELPLGEPRDHDVAEASRADHAADDDHGEHVEQA